MKKIIPLLGLFLVAAIAGLIGLDHYRERRAQQQAQSAQLLASCVNRGLLSLFHLQANDWRRRPHFQREEQRRLEGAVATLPEKNLVGEPFPEWKVAADICAQLTRHSAVQHRTIFASLGDLSAISLAQTRDLKDRRTLQRRLRTLRRLQNSARAAERYLDDLRADIDTQLQNSELSQASRERAAHEIQSQVLERFRRGHFSRAQVVAHLGRLERYYRLLAEHPRGYSLRGGSLFFYDRELRAEVEQVYNAILQGEAAFYGAWTQIVAQQQGAFGTAE